MKSMLEPESLLRLAGLGMVLHLACSAWLRSRIEQSTVLVEELFGHPALAHKSSTAWLLRGKYILPWVPAPVELRDHILFHRLLLVAARVGATVLVVGFMAFFARIFWRIGHP
jgi:hypothetical protein